MNNILNVICFPQNNKIYGIDIAFARELVLRLNVVDMLGLPSIYLGIANYKGEIVPITSFEKLEGRYETEYDDSYVALLQLEVYQLGIVSIKEPFFLQISKEQKVSFIESDGGNYLKIKECYVADDKIISILDFEYLIKRLLNEQI